MNRDELAADVFRVAHLTGEFRLRSGTVSHDYFDKYRFESEPRLLAAIADALVPLIPAGGQVLAGLELGGIPVATALSRATGLPAAFVRKAAKTYGTCQLAEGAAIDGRSVVIVEDVVTSGGQLIESAKALRILGAVVTDAVCVIDREANAVALLAAEGIRLHALFKMSELKGTVQPGR
ncbi:MAG: phosphoribosyltransferase family protein [Vicinamibacterales bacterium]